MKLNKVHHTAIICSNYETSKNFYVNILGLDVINETYRKERRSHKLDLKIHLKEQVIQKLVALDIYALKLMI